MFNREVKNEMHIVYASDDNFAEIMGVSIVSLLENNQDIDKIYIYILDSGIKGENKEKVEQIFKKYNRLSPIWIPAININDEIGMEVKQDRGSISQFARLFISRVLPDNLHRVLYLDCDTIVNKSLNELWTIDMQGKIIAALLDPFSTLYRKNLGLEKRDILINSGVMLIDFKRWKEDRIEEKIIGLIKEYKGLIPQGDQGALGAILSKETAILNPKFNSITLFYDFSYENMLIYRKPPYYYSKEEIIDAKNDPTIIHFTTSFLSKRAWVKGSKHPFTNSWLKYKSISPWKDNPVRTLKVKWWKRIYVKLYYIIPIHISLRFSGFLQAYVRPIAQKIQYRI